jgi:hypothetical protein
MTIRLACDSNNPDALIETDIVLTYSDLIPHEGAHQELKARFPRSVVELIDRGLGDPTGRATILDVERGARSPSQAPGWFDDKHQAGLRWLTVYASLVTMRQVDTAMGKRTGWWRWFAYWGNGLVVPGHDHAAIQFASDKMLGARVDLSLFPNPAWHPTPLWPSRVTKIPAGLVTTPESTATRPRN